MKKNIIRVFLGLLVVPFVSVLFYVLGEGIIFFLTTQFFFPVEEEYLFTYEKKFNCEKSENPLIIDICKALDKIKKDRLIKRPESLERLGFFRNNFINFINGDKKINFYYSKNLGKAKLTEPPEKSGLKSLNDRIRFFLWYRIKYFLWSKSVQYNSNMYSNPFLKKITIGPDFLRQDISDDAFDITHEILHLCWATEEEVRFLMTKLNSVSY